jgi:hypothetical protein
LSDAGRVEHERVRKAMVGMDMEPLEALEGLNGLGFGAVIRPIFPPQAERIPRPSRACSRRSRWSSGPCPQSLSSIQSPGRELGDDA